MNNPRYSILYCGHVLQSFIEEIDSLLKEGVKVIWFGKENDLTELEKGSQNHLVFVFCRYIGPIIIQKCGLSMGI